MQPHDSKEPRILPAVHQSSHGPYPDQISRDEGRAEGNEVATTFSPHTGPRTKRAVIVAVIVLSVCLVFVTILRLLHSHSIDRAGEAVYSTPPPVDVVVARAATAGQDLVLPGETAAWYETNIYARVNGYVSMWLVDIGDHVKKGQVLAIIETPELDAELQAARAIKVFALSDCCPAGRSRIQQNNQRALLR